MSAIDEVVDAQRAALAAREADTAARLSRAYAAGAQDIRRDLDALTARAGKARAAGTPISPSWVNSDDRYRSLLDQTYRQADELSRLTGELVDEDRAWASAFGGDMADTLLAVELRGDDLQALYSRMDTDAVEALSAAVRDELSPLRPILEQMAPGATARAAGVLESGLIRGVNPNVMARDLAALRDGDISRARTIARTETHRAFRTSTQRNYQDIGLTKWRWLATLSPRTCPMCWAMHGKTFPSSESMASHPACRCAMAPAVRGAAAVGTGVDEFDRLPAADQRRILGPAAHEAYTDGAFDLDDMVGVTTSGAWGTGRNTRSLKSVVGETKADEYRQRVRPSATKKSAPEPKARPAPPPKKPRRLNAGDLSTAQGTAIASSSMDLARGRITSREHKAFVRKITNTDSRGHPR